MDAEGKRKEKREKRKEKTENTDEDSMYLAIRHDWRGE
jgi:hypothetical protein